jgi:hypothetical protein
MQQGWGFLVQQPLSAASVGDSDGYGRQVAVGLGESGHDDCEAAGCGACFEYGGAVADDRDRRMPT